MAKLDSGAMTIGNNDNWREIFDDQNATAVAANQATADLAPIINGKRCALSVASGGFVLLRNSTITGKADGAYTAAKAIPANTDLDGSYLTAVSGGVANALNSKITNNVYSTRVSLDVNESFAPNYQKVYYIDISSYKAAYNTVVLLGDAGADGSTFASFGLKYCYIDGNTACVAVINLSSNTVELKKVGVSILCVNPK